ncbi:MAG TPA: ABC transporter permease [Acidimicrobiaceae bacterium]|nr:ABC transporter permease [Acidimicrobiaceae bacterium]HCB37362.1 ABC transporter permease [Acidimicrobiaceae bacterium]
MSGTGRAAAIRPARLRLRDALGVGTLGLRARKARSTLTALGIAIGIAAMIAVLGITASSDAQLQAELDALGPDLLDVTPGESVTGDAVEFVAATSAMIERIGPVEQAAALSPVDATVRRTEFVPVGQTGGIAVLVADDDLPAVLEVGMAAGDWLSPEASTLPNVVLGEVAAERLGVRGLAGSPQLYIGDTYFSVTGILESAPLAPRVDRAAFVGEAIATRLFEFEAQPQRVFVRVGEEAADDAELLDQVRAVIAATARPEAPSEVQVSRPSDLLAARESAEAAFTGLLLGLGAVALLVGGVGIANVMVISVLERRTEIGVRRALGATKRHVGVQFVVESALLAAVGGVGGVAAGAAITAGYARSRDWVIAVPFTALALGIAAALAIGALAGLYPAARAARLDPAEAVHPAG